MSWAEVRDRLATNTSSFTDEGGILCQCCPPHLELRRGGRYIVSVSNVLRVFIEARICNTHPERAFDFQLRYSENRPIFGSDVLGSTWHILDIYHGEPNTQREFDIDITDLVTTLAKPLYFISLIDVDYNNTGWPTRLDCDFSAIFQIKNIICTSSIPDDKCRP